MQINLFTGKIEAETAFIEPETEIIPPPPRKPSKKRRKDYDVRRCRKCDQLILSDPNNDRDNGLCESCDSRLSHIYDKFKNKELIKALRIHKYLRILLALIILNSCVPVKEIPIKEDSMIVTRVYAGNFMDFRTTPPVIWIKTTMEDKYGKIAVYSKRCEFKNGEHLYIRRTFLSPGGLTGYWSYSLENEAGDVYYRLYSKIAF